MLRRLKGGGPFFPPIAEQGYDPTLRRDLAVIALFRMLADYQPSAIVSVNAAPLNKDYMDSVASWEATQDEAPCSFRRICLRLVSFYGFTLIWPQASGMLLNGTPITTFRLDTVATWLSGT